MPDDTLEQIDRHLASPHLAWLFGAGISVDGCIPLMQPLTVRIRAKLKEKKSKHLELIEAIAAQLPDGAHVEQILSHLGDYTEIVKRSRSKQTSIGKKSYSGDDIEAAHHEIVAEIAETIRWGYRPKCDTEPEAVGEPGAPIVNVDTHRSFALSVFGAAQAGLQDHRSAVKFFTTNYDTLLEDALAIEGIPYWDGFSGGAVAHRTHFFGQCNPDPGCRAWIVKLHGSIDWHLAKDGRVLRVRDGDSYPSHTQRVLIYPQSTKYVATQKDPFAAQFDLFRRQLSQGSENVLAFCGYSFGDDHINDEIVQAMRQAKNKTTIIAFCPNRCACVESWQEEGWGNRVYAVTSEGVYVGKEGPHHPPTNGSQHDWWKFAGVTQMIGDGAESLL